MFVVTKGHIYSLTPPSKSRSHAFRLCSLPHFSKHILLYFFNSFAFIRFRLKKRAIIYTNQTLIYIKTSKNTTKLNML